MSTRSRFRLQKHFPSRGSWRLHNNGCRECGSRQGRSRQKYKTRVKWVSRREEERDGEASRIKKSCPDRNIARRRHSRKLLSLERYVFSNQLVERESRRKVVLVIIRDAIMPLDKLSRSRFHSDVCLVKKPMVMQVITSRGRGILGMHDFPNISVNFSPTTFLYAYIVEFLFYRKIIIIYNLKNNGCATVVTFNLLNIYLYTSPNDFRLTFKIMTTVTIIRRSLFVKKLETKEVS